MKMKKIKLAKSGDIPKQEFPSDQIDNDDQDHEDDEDDDIDVGSTGIQSEIKFEPSETSLESKFHLPPFPGINFSFPVLTNSKPTS